MGLLNFYASNWWAAPITFAVADAIVYLTPWHGDDEIIATIYKAYKKYFGKGTG